MDAAALRQLAPLAIDARARELARPDPGRYIARPLLRWMATLFAPRRLDARTRSDPPPPPRDRSRLYARGREASALLLCFAAVYTALALLSFRADPADPSLVGADWVGPVGAAFARFFVGTLGIVGALVPVELFLFAWPLLRERASIATLARLFGDLVVLFVLASLVQIAAAGGTAFGQMPIAGGVGELFGEVLRSAFSTVGSFLVGLTSIGLILIARQSFSFIGSAQRAITGTQTAAEKARTGAALVAEAWKSAAELRRERERRAEPEVHDEDAADAIILGAEPEIPETPSSPGLKVLSPVEPKLAVLADDAVTPPPPSEPRVDEAPASADEAPALLAPEPALGARIRLASEPPPPAEPAASEIQIVDHVAEPDVEPEKPRAKRRRLVEEAPLEIAFTLPSTDLLAPPPPNVVREDRDALIQRARELERVLANYGVKGTVADIHTGPTVSTFEVVPAEGTKVSKVASLADDLALGLSCKVRIIAPIPGKSRIGFELPNKERIPVSLRELVEDRRFTELSAPLPTVLGRDIVGAPFYADLSAMPHVIVAGATGAGKSVGLNVMLVSLLMRRTPEDLRLLMIDPKVVELAPFDRIPHLLLPVVTDMKQASNALKWAVDEMERRYQLFANAGTKNITTYNGWVARAHAGELKQFAAPPEPSTVTDDGVLVELGPEREAPKLPEKLPYIVIVVDEFADLMMQQGKDVEAAIARLAQKARAAGMHVILATQRPSVDVITGMIKANFPTRIGFRVAQRVDSRTILDEMGAEHLLGRGDMLVKMNGTNDVRRVQCPFVSEEEVQAVTDHLRSQGEPVYDESIVKNRDEDGDSSGEDEDGELDAKYDDAVRVVAETRRCSTSWLQRKLGLGYNRAAKIVEVMEKRGVVGPPNGSKDREVLIGPL